MIIDFLIEIDLPRKPKTKHARPWVDGVFMHYAPRG